jgi:erythromycin esterase-like protein
MQRHFAPILVLILLIASSSASFASSPAEIAPGVYPFLGNDPELPHDDLRPLRQIIGSARFVGLGEPLHTSGGVYRMKHRLLRYLVEELHFRVLAFENPWQMAEPVARYVETCQGTPEAAMSQMFGVWQSTELADTLRWMCAWNQAHPEDPVHFYGFDIQIPPRRSADPLLAFLSGLGMGDDHPWIEGVRACDGVVDTYFPVLPYPEDLYRQCRGALSEIGAWFDAEENRIRELTSREALGWARVHLASLDAMEGLLFHLPTRFPQSYDERERGMAYVVQAIHALRHPNLKVAVWAANGHVAPNTRPAFGLDSVGTHLAAAMGSHYKAVGISARDIYANWPARGRCGLQVLADPADSVERLLLSLGSPHVIVDQNPPGSHPAFQAPDAWYTLGDIPFTRELGLFDGLLVIESSPAMHALRWADCG